MSASTSSAQYDEPAVIPLWTLIEDARLGALDRCRMLSAGDVEGLSRLSREAAASFGATQATVSFVDSTRVWFGGAYGFETGEVARENSFCDAVVRSGTALVVENAKLDPRFWEHALIRTAPGVRSYAGVPLVDGGGYTLGTVAVYSVGASRFTTELLPKLAGIATLVRDFLAEACQPASQTAASGIQGWFGVRAKAGGTAGAGLVIISVKPSSPAAEAGLRPTDVIHSLGGHELHETTDIATALAGRPAGSRVRVRFRRGWEWQERDVVIRARRRIIKAR